MSCFFVDLRVYSFVQFHFQSGNNEEKPIVRSRKTHSVALSNFSLPQLLVIGILFSLVIITNSIVRLYKSNLRYRFEFLFYFEYEKKKRVPSYSLIHLSGDSSGNWKYLTRDIIFKNWILFFLEIIPMDESEGSVVQGNEGVETKQSRIPASTPEWILTNVFFSTGPWQMGSTKIFSSRIARIEAIDRSDENSLWI